MQNTYTLGLDIGPNSIGWALIDEQQMRIINVGVRVFPEGVDKFDTSKEESRNEKRRNARGMRRQTARRSRRKRNLRAALTAAGLLPADAAEQERILATNPYELRAKALDEQLSLHELGRVFLHLNQRRGFLSNRKKDRGDAEVKGMLEEISILAKEITASGCRTLGEYLYRKYEKFDHAHRADDDHVRNRHTRRDMLIDEFEKIWDAQAKFHPSLLTEKLRYGTLGKRTSPARSIPMRHNQSAVDAYGIFGLMFFQRKMYWPKSVVGLCELEPKEKRCPREDRHSHRFRVLQEVNNLRYIDPDVREEEKLNPDQRKLLLDLLATKEKATFDEIRKKLGFIDSIKFNLERGERSSIKGMVIDHTMAKATGKDWHKRPDAEKDAVVRMLLDNEREDELIAGRLVNELGFTHEQADAALSVDLKPGYGSLSLKAIDKLLPYLEQGMVYQSVSDPEQSALHAAGYLRRDELHRRLFDRLPDPTRVNPRDCAIGDIPNPVVKRTLVELRKVINAIIREYGKPDEVHVEMARSVQMGQRARREFNTKMRERETERDKAAEEIRRYRDKYPSSGLRVNRDSILRYLLWRQQNYECMYCDKAISQDQLFGGEIDVDHILPYSRCLDDSQNNKVVCHRQCNHDKRERTPAEWLADADPRRYEMVCQRAASLMQRKLIPYGKYRKFLQQELELDEFIARQLTDTAYIARATAEYLRLLFERDHDVLGLKGQHTAELRRQWGLNTVLRHDDKDMKNREDHRHHAVDAVVVALTNRKRLQQLSRGMSEVAGKKRDSGEVEYRQAYGGEAISEPWENFRPHVESAINGINVSHRAERKVGGALHEETFYGSTPTPGVFVVRKNLEALSANEIPLIRDVRIRQLIEQRLAEHGIDVGRGKKVDPKTLKKVVSDPENPLTLPPSKKRLEKDPAARGVPIKKVRVFRNELTIQPIRNGKTDATYVKPGATHHLCIFEWEEKGKKKRDAVFVTQLEAINRVKSRLDVIRRSPPAGHLAVPPHARFLMSLSRGEMVLADWKGEKKLLVYKTAASTQGQIYFAEHTDARKSSDYKKFVANANTLRAQKITVDALGRVRNAND